MKTMRVQGPANINPIRSSRGANHVSPASRRSTGDGAEVSSIATALASAKGPEIIDEARVQRLKQAIQSGTFTIQPDAIAEQMIAEEL